MSCERDQAAAWCSVWDKLKSLHPELAKRPGTGEQNALDAIDHLAAWEKFGKGIVPYLREREKDLRTQLASVGITVDGPKETP